MKRQNAMTPIVINFFLVVNLTLNNLIREINILEIITSKEQILVRASCLIIYLDN